MGYSKEVYRNAAAKLADQRAKAEREAKNAVLPFSAPVPAPRRLNASFPVRRWRLPAPFWGAEMCAKTFPG